MGVGYTAFRPTSPEVSFREMIFEAATKAYDDAGVEPEQIETFVSFSEDYLEGTAIADEYVPDQLGAVLKPVHTVAADGITALGSAYLQLSTGEFDIAVVEGRSKASNVLHPSHIEAFALDPVYVRPLNFHPSFVAGLEMQRFLDSTGNTERQVAGVVVKNRQNALRNPLAAFGALVGADDVLKAPVLAAPLKDAEVAPYADGAIVMVLATSRAASKLKGKPVYIRGIGWSQDTPNLEERDWSVAKYARAAATRAYAMAEIANPSKDIDFAEIDDTFAYKELQHLEALEIAPAGRSGAMLEDGFFSVDGSFPTNVSGGNLGCGYAYDLSGLRSTLEVVLQLRGEAGKRQLGKAKTGLAQSWRGIPTASGGVVVLGTDGLS